MTVLNTTPFENPHFNNPDRPAYELGHLLRELSSDLAPEDTYTRLAMKAQAQCRSTVEAIAEIKYPKSATFIKQANIAQHQQVNSGKAPAHPREKDITPTNELLTESAHATLDAGRTAAAIGLDPQLEAMGKSKRAAH